MAIGSLPSSVEISKGLRRLPTHVGELSLQGRGGPCFPQEQRANKNGSLLCAFDLLHLVSSAEMGDRGKPGVLQGSRSCGVPCRFQ